MKVLVLVLTLVTSSIAASSASTITTSTCTVGSQSATDFSNCSIGGPSNFTPNSANASVTIGALTPVNAPIINFALSISESGAAQGPTSSHASASVRLDYLFSVGGPVRQGVLQVTSSANWDGSAGSNREVAGVSFGSITGACAGRMAALCTGLMNHPGAPFQTPFTLGSPFEFIFSEQFTADGSGSDAGFAVGATQFSFSLLEADGKTQVTFSPVPEPNTTGLMLTSVAGLLLFASHRKAARL